VALFGDFALLVNTLQSALSNLRKAFHLNPGWPLFYNQGTKDQQEIPQRSISFLYCMICRVNS
jgi:hypothetical protein